MKRKHWPVGLAGLMLLAPGTSLAQSGYNIQSLVKAGDTIAGVQLAPSNEPDFQIVGLNDNGDLVFYALNTAGQRVLFDYNDGQFTRIAGEGDTIGGVVLAHFQGGGDGPTTNGQTTFLGSDANGKDLLFQYAGGRTSLIAAPGTPVAEGKVAAQGITKPVSMNWQGNVVFQAYLTPTTPYPPGIHIPTQAAVFLWNSAKQQLTTVAGPGTKLGDLTILNANGGDPPVINSNGEMVVNVSGTLSAAPFYVNGLLLIGADGKIQPIAQYGQKLPDGKTTSGGSHPALNDAGVVAFAPTPGAADTYYLWDKATGSRVGPIMTVGQDAGGGNSVASIEALALDPRTASGLFQVRLNDRIDGPGALYQFLAFPDIPPAQGAPASTAGAHVADVGCPGMAPVPADGSNPWTSSSWWTPWPGDEYRDEEMTVRGPAGEDDRPSNDPYERALDPLFGKLSKDEAMLSFALRASGWSAAVGDNDDVREDLGWVIMLGISGTRGPQSYDSRPGPFISLATPNIYLTHTGSGEGAAYWIGADRQPKLLLEDGMSTGVGTIRQVWVYQLELGNGGWNDYYQVALRANIADAGGSAHDAILLLTPTSAP